MPEGPGRREKIIDSKIKTVFSDVKVVRFMVDLFPLVLEVPQMTLFRSFYLFSYFVWNYCDNVDLNLVLSCGRGWHFRIGFSRLSSAICDNSVQPIF